MAYCAIAGVAPVSKATARAVGRRNPMTAQLVRPRGFQQGYGQEPRQSPVQPPELLATLFSPTADALPPALPYRSLAPVPVMTEPAL